MCPLNIRLGPPPVARPGAEHVRAAVLDLLPLHLQAHRRRTCRAISSAIACSSPVKLGVAIACEAHSTSRSSLIGDLGHPRNVRQHLLGEEADLLVAVGAPELEHHVRAARVAVLLDRRDAVGGRAGDRLAAVEQRVGHLLLRGEPAAALHRLGDRRELVHLDLGQVEQRVGRARMFWNLLARYIAGDLARAVAAAVAVVGVDRGDDRAADVDRPRVAARLRGALARRSRACSATNAGVVIDGVSRPSPISPPSCCISGAVAAT